MIVLYLNSLIVYDTPLTGIPYIHRQSHTTHAFPRIHTQETAVFNLVLELTAQFARVVKFDPRALPDICVTILISMVIIVN